jgi:hypothetical protein
MLFASVLLALASAAGPQAPRNAAPPPAPSGSLSAASALELAHAAAALPRWVKRAAGGWERSAPLLELRRRVEAGQRFESEVWRVLLVDGRYLQWRSDWPLEAPFAVGLTALPLSHGFELRLQPRLEGWSPASVRHFEMMCGLADEHLAELAAYQELGRLSPDQREVRFDVFIDIGSGSHLGDRGARVAEIVIGVRPRERIGDVLTPVTDFAVSRTIAHALRIGVGSDPRHVTCAELTVRDAPWPSSLSCDFEVELLREGRVVSAQSFVFRAGGSGRSGLVWLKELSPQIARGDLPATGWTLRLRGSPLTALRNWNATHCWAGTLEAPLADVVSRSPGRSRRP